MGVPSVTVERRERQYLPGDFKLQTYEDVRPYLDDLVCRNITSLGELEQWLLDRSELESYLSEDLAWRYINYTRNTSDKDVEASYLYFVQEINPKISPYEHLLDSKLLEDPFLEELDENKYRIYLQLTRISHRIYREKNIQLFSKIRSEAQRFSAITGDMTVEINGEEYTMQQASVFLKDPDRSIRQNAYIRINERRLADAPELDELFGKLVEMRHEVALNAGFENYRDYKFVELGRLDYSVNDVLEFHDSVREEIIPILRDNNLRRKQNLGLDELKPYDLGVDEELKPPLKPVSDGEELIEKTITCFSRIKPELGEYLTIMRDMGYLDLESRKGKAPGGYNYPLDEVGIPFIFMNASGLFRDLTTMVHEGGHAIHSFLTRDYNINAFRHTPSEVAELASMGMELISMDHWDVFFEDPDDLRRAKKSQLESVIEVLPWVATISRFQHWIYTHPGHSVTQRDQAWLEIFEGFSTEVLDWTGLEKFKSKAWHRQGHLFDVPFYYIEYGIAQLGAIAIWKRFREDPVQGLEDYLSALKLGYTVSVPDIYEQAGIKFDFSREYIRDLAVFVRGELTKLS